MTFSDVVEGIKSLSTEEKQEIQLLLQQYLREERRDEIHNNFKAAQAEEKNRELPFSANLEDLERFLRAIA